MTNISADYLCSHCGEMHDIRDSCQEHYTKKLQAENAALKDMLDLIYRTDVLQGKAYSALAGGRPGEAHAWMRLHEKAKALLEAEEDEGINPDAQFGVGL